MLGGDLATNRFCELYTNYKWIKPTDPVKTGIGATILGSKWGYPPPSHWTIVRFSMRMRHLKIKEPRWVKLPIAQVWGRNANEPAVLGPPSPTGILWEYCGKMMGFFVGNISSSPINPVFFVRKKMENYQPTSKRWHFLWTIKDRPCRHRHNI